MKKVLPAGFDEWGNEVVLCPACRKIFKVDGIATHIRLSEGHTGIVPWSRPRTHVSLKNWPWQHLQGAKEV